jgi:parallel beta-helix repeat protein
MRSAPNPAGPISRREALRLLGVVSFSYSGLERSFAPRTMYRRFSREHDSLRIDQTDALQSAIDYAAKRGSVVKIPNGSYYVDAARGLRLHSGSRMHLSPETVIYALPNDLSSYAVLRCHSVEDVIIRGGRIVGDRDTHVGQLGEWGMGISVLSSDRVTIRDIVVERCWGDGIYIGADAVLGGRKGPSRRVQIERVTCQHNRRQGLSLTNCVGATISQSSFSYTFGTAPQAGVDIEPEGDDHVTALKFTGCKFFRNSGAGLQMGGTGTVSDILVEHCSSFTNKGRGIYLDHVSASVIVDNDIRLNDGIGIAVVASNQNKIRSNRLDANDRETTRGGAEIVLADGASKNRLDRNLISNRLGRASAWIIRIDDPDCKGNVISRTPHTKFGNARISDRGTATIIAEND